MMSSGRDKTRTRVTRRALLAGFAAAPIAACSSSDTSENAYGLNYSAVTNALAVSLGIKEPPSVSREDAAAIPYSSIGYRIGGSGEGLLILGSQTGDTLLWTASSRVVIVTRGGRITKTAGLPWNLSSTVIRGNDPAADFDILRSTSSASRALDFPDLARYAVSVKSEFADAGNETIQILGQPLATRVVIENCNCAEFNWQFQNKYWIDSDTAFAWRTLQFTHPKMDPLRVEVFRPPA